MPTVKVPLLPEPEVTQTKPLFEHKHLLTKGGTLARLAKQNKTLRQALGTIKVDTAVGIHVENWLNLPLRLRKLNIGSGKVLQGHEAGQIAPAPGDIESGSQDAGVIVQNSVLSGTSGVVRWNIGDGGDRVLSVMWSIPYSQQIWRTWLAVGLSFGGPDLPTYNQMYSSNDPTKFIRRPAGQSFEFSDGEYLIIARMDGSSRSKQILHLAIAPMSNGALADSIRKELGMKDSPYIRQRKQGGDEPVYGLVQGQASVADGALSQRQTSAVLVILLLTLLRVV